MGCDHRRRSDRCRHHIAARRAWCRHRSFFGVALVIGQSDCDYLHPARCSVAHHRAVVVVGIGRLLEPGGCGPNGLGLHTDEVYFRDTAHGFLAWALASVLVAAFATSSISSAVGTATRAVSSVAGSAASGAAQVAANQSPGSADYFLDTLFRRDQPDANASPQDARAEASRILTRSLANATIDPNDRAYLAKLIAARAGISQQDAEKRIDDTVAQMKAAEEKAKQAADAARKASASASFYLFFSMLIGAFIASTAGAIGGRQRDL